MDQPNDGGDASSSSPCFTNSRVVGNVWCRSPSIFVSGCCDAAEWFMVVYSWACLLCRVPARPRQDAGSHHGCRPRQRDYHRTRREQRHLGHSGWTLPTRYWKLSRGLCLLVFGENVGFFSFWDELLPFSQNFTVSRKPTKCLFISGAKLPSSQENIVIYTAETLGIAVATSVLAALVVGFVGGFLFSRRCRPDDYSDMPRFPDNQRHQLNR